MTLGCRQRTGAEAQERSSFDLFTFEFACWSLQHAVYAWTMCRHKPQKEGQASYVSSNHDSLNDRAETATIA